MKKSYLYFIAPILGLAVFSIFYWQYASSYDARQEAIAKAQRDVKDAKLHEEARLREKAIKEAVAAQEQRKAAKAAKEAKDAAEREARDKAVAALRKAKEDARKLFDQAKRLDREIEDTKKEIAKIEEDKKHSLDEQAFLREHVKKTEANAQSLTTVIEKIDAADKAREAAEREAAIAAKAKKSS